MSNSKTYKPGNPEYDFWNDKNLYPSLKNYGDEGFEDPKIPHPAPHASIPYENDAKVSGATVFVTIFLWLLILAPFAFLFTWQDFIVQLLFWGGLAIILLIFTIWFISAIKSQKK